jgi:hypothetical protein
MVNLKPWFKLSLHTQNCINTDFNFDFLLRERKQNDKLSPIYLWNYHGDNIFKVLNKDWVIYLKNNGLDIDLLTIFYRDANYQHPVAHTDTAKDPRLISKISLPLVINFVTNNDDDSEMSWYQLPNETGTVSNEGNTYAAWTWWPMEITTLIDKVNIGKDLTLVRVDLPHNVIMGNNPRWVISMRTKNSVNGWSEAVDYVKHLIKE